MQYPIEYNNWYAGESSDKYIGQEGSFYEGEKVQIRKNSRAFYLSNDTSSETEVEGLPVAFYGTNNLNLLTFTNNCYINGYYYPKDRPLYKAVNPNDGAYVNLVPYNIGGTDYLIIVRYSTIDRTEYASGEQDYNLIDTNIVSNGDFALGDTNWTVNSGWSTASGKAVHTTGTDTLQQTLGSLLGSTYYRIQFTIASRTTGSVAVSCGGTSLGSFSTNGYKTNFITTTNTDPIVFTPTNDFNGSIDDVYVQKCLVDEGYGNLTNGTDYRPVAIFNGELYIGGDNIIDTVDGSTGTVTNVLTLPKGDNIRSMIVMGDQMIIFTDSSIFGGLGKQYIWSGVAGIQPEAVKLWNNEPIVNAIMANTNSYCITYNRRFGTEKKRLYAVAGYEKQALFTSDYIENNTDKFNFKPERVNALCVGNDDIVYIPAPGKIYTYGSIIPGLAPGIVGEYTYSGTGEVGALHYMGDKFVIGYKNSGDNLYYITSKTLTESSNTWASTGYIKTLQIAGRKYGAKKKIQSIQLGYSMSDGNEINVYVSFEQGAFTQIYNMTDHTKNKITIDRNSDLQLEFFETQIKIEIVKGTASATPYIYDLTVIVDELETEKNI